MPNVNALGKKILRSGKRTPVASAFGRAATKKGRAIRAALNLVA
jgi:hypothetical protein